ncbi:hypothetical protein HD806DRAFT_490319 [Xylariaceae sp. AK1471]|nr:hypothetical protein HD806DRAFT_490319 [Xylariaceae sp. AK1471]
MLRLLRVGSRNPAHDLTSRLCRWPRSQQSITGQLHFSSRPGIPRHGPRTNNHDQNGKGPRQLHAHIFCSIYTSIGFLVLNEALDWDTRRALAVDTVQSITLEMDTEQRWRKFYETGESLLAAYSGAEVEHHEGAIRLRADDGWGDEIETRILTAPDPDVEGGILVLSLTTLRDPEEETYLPINGNRLTDATEAVLPEIEAFASRLPNSPRVRGAILLLEQNRDWKCVYWDGKRWINIVYLEWQTAESMNLPSENDFE